MKYVLIDQQCSSYHNKKAYIKKGNEDEITFDINKAQLFDEHYVNVVISLNNNFKSEPAILVKNSRFKPLLKSLLVRA